MNSPKNKLDAWIAMLIWKRKAAKGASLEAGTAGVLAGGMPDLPNPAGNSGKEIFHRAAAVTDGNSIKRMAKLVFPGAGPWMAAALFAMLATAASAQSTNAAALSPTPALPNAVPSLLRVFGALVFVIALFLAFVWLLRNWQRLMIRQGRAPRLNVLEVRSLGGRNSIYVVGYEQDRFLIASSPNGVNLLSHLPQAAESGNAGTAATAVPFAQALTQVLKGKG